MKARIGFVSNSSSSSYIIAQKKRLPSCLVCNRRGINFINLLSEMRYNEDSESTRIHAIGVGNVINKAEWLILNDPTIVEKLKEYQQTHDLAYLDISYHDSEIKEIFRMCKDCGDIVVIGECD